MRKSLGDNIEMTTTLRARKVRILLCDS